MIVIGKPVGRYLLRDGGCEIPFRVNLTDRPKLTITVHPDMTVDVQAPVNKSLDLILARVDRRGQWIVKQWRYFEQFQPKLPDRQFVSGETHVYLGRQYRLKVAKGMRPDVKLLGRYFQITHPDPKDTAAISSLLQDWYLRHAQSLFAQRIRYWTSESLALKIMESPKLTVRSMNRRWGSCTKTGTITLNIDLIKVPLMYIDYVIVHELCHLKIHNHSPAFYRLLTRCMPDWEKRKRRLDEFAV